MKVGAAPQSSENWPRSVHIGCLRQTERLHLLDDRDSMVSVLELVMAKKGLKGNRLGFC